MAKFKVVKKFSLDFLGKDWKDAYINFQVLSIADIKNKFPGLIKIDQNDPDSILSGMDLTTEILENSFVDGKGYDGIKLVDLKREDIKDLPNDLIKRGLDFLSQGVIAPSFPQ